MNDGQDICYRALQTRDQRFDGRFFTGVITTGVFCRPVCPAVTPKRENCRFFPSAAAAISQGFRPCLRCRPEAAPGSPAWNGVTTTVTRALRLIADGALDDGGVDALADRLGITARHLRRLFDEHLGASPLAVAQSQRLLFAKKLITETSLPLNEIAIMAGFGSVRRFNDAMRKLYGHAPGELRRSKSAEPAGGRAAIQLKLAFHPPYDWQQISSFLQSRAIPGVEQADATVYRRSVSFDSGAGLLEVRPLESVQQLQVRFDFPDTCNLQLAVNKTRRLFDLDVDREEINTLFADDPLLGRLVTQRPGLRVPGAWDLFELGVRAILGQQISVPAARTLAGRLVEQFGEPLLQYARGEVTHLFPTPAVLADNDVSLIGLPKKRAASINALAAAFPDLLPALDNCADLKDIETALCRIPGIGPWTAQYIAMRALGEPDAFPKGDLGLIRALQAMGHDCTITQLQALAENWRPFRAYAALHLWTGLADNKEEQ
ncbi:MAG: DNA-3-methyladenine glycosylase 2 family protein [Gammaproteobacteria bacterium]|nr:DNA-3-methyladenine glycosylase 2 family protein [Gammaproteobacteria bacterium]